jgi:hypothetical protein
MNVVISWGKFIASRNSQTRLAHNKKNIFSSFYFDVVKEVSVSPLFKDMSLTDGQILEQFLLIF